MLQRQERSPRRTTSPTVVAPALSATPSWDTAPVPSPSDATAHAPSIGFNFANIAIFPPGLQVGPGPAAAQAAPLAIQRQAESGPPADAQARDGFNPMDINHRLLRAIDQSHLTIVGSESHAYGLYSEPIFKRHIDFAETVAALGHLTALQVDDVKKAYKDHENRTLENDIFGPGESGYVSDLTADQSAQIRALIGGTAAATGASAEEQQSAATNAMSAKAANLHQLLGGDLEKDDVERVMTTLRQDAKANDALVAAYGQLGGDLRGDIWKMGTLAGQRALMLLLGETVRADALKVSNDRARIGGIDDRIKEILEDLKENPMGAMSAQYEIKDLQKERKELVEDIEQRAEQAGAEARAGAQGDPHAAVQARVAAVIGDAGAMATAVGGTDAAVIRGIASDDPVEKVAAQLRKASADGKLNAEQLTAALRSLRTEAEERAQQTLPKGDPRVEAETKRLADEYFMRIRGAYNSLIGSDDKKFDELIDDMGNEGDTTVNIALMQNHGKLDDIAELVLALSGDRKDTATVERVLRDKSAREIAQLRVEYSARTGGRSLDFDLFGDAPTRAGEETTEIGGVEVHRDTLQPVIKGKASGTDRLNLEDAMQRPDTEGGPTEVAYLLERAEREYQYTIDNRGATGAVRDTFGNEERDLLDETIKEVRRLHQEYGDLVGWFPLMDPAGVNLEQPEMTHSGKAHGIIQQMRLARATIRGDRAAYEKATAQLRAMFEMAAAFVLQAAISALLTPAAGALLEAVELGADAVEAGVMTARIAKFAASTSVNVVSTVSANLAVYGDDYSVAMLKADLLGGLGGSLGGEAVEKMLGPVAKGMADRLGSKISGEIVGLAKTAGSIEGGAWAQGMEGDLTLQGVIKMHLMGKAAHAIGETTKSAVGLPPGSETVVTYDESAAPEHATPEPGKPGVGAGAMHGEEPVRIPSRLPAELPSAPRAAEPAMTSEPGEVAPKGKATEPGTGEKPTRARAPARDNGGTGEEHQRPERTVTPVESIEKGHALFDEALREDPLRDVMVYRQRVTGEVVVGRATARGVPLDSEAQMRALGGPPGTWEVEAEYRAQIPEGSAMWADTTEETRALYEQSLAEDPYREVSRYVNTETGEERIAQGGADEVGLDPDVWKEALPGDPNKWESPEHYHPIDPTLRVTPVAQRFPTSRGGDFEKLQGESQRAGNEARSARISLVTKRGRDYTEFTVDPGKSRPFKINFPDPKTGERLVKVFKSLEAYEEWHDEKFPGWRVGFDPEPPASGGGGSTPAARAPMKEGGGPGGAEGEETGQTLADEPTDTGTDEPVRPAPGPEEEPTGASDLYAHLDPAELLEIAERNVEVRQLVQGEGLALPETTEEMERSNTEVELAQHILQEPNIGPGDPRVHEAIRTVIERAVAEYRAYHTSGVGKTGKALGLTADDLRLKCMAGRDISAEAIIALIGNSPHKIQIERIQAKNLGLDVQHAFAVVTLADGTRFLVDPTFAQFADENSRPVLPANDRPGQPEYLQEEGMGLPKSFFTAGRMLESAEGSTLARDLLRDGMVPLTDDAWRLYVTGLGGDQATVDAATARLMSGGAAALTEVVRNGLVERFAGRPNETHEHMTTASDPVVSPLASLRIMLSRIPEGDPRRPLLESLMDQINELQNDPERFPPLP